MSESARPVTFSGVLTLAAATRLGCPEYANVIVEFEWAENGNAKNIHWKGKCLGSGIRVGPDGIIVEADN